MKKVLLAAVATMLLWSSCGKAPQHDIVIKTPAERLITRLDTLRHHGVMYGHQDDPFYGLTWAWEEGRSDTKDLLGDYPAVMGFDLGGIEMDDSKNLDSVPFSRIREEAIAHYKRGGIITFSWHPRNPRTGGNAWDVSDTTVVHNLLPGGEQHEKFVGWMERVATFLKTIQTNDGHSIPFILRPWHEYNGSWFWWGQKLCSDQDFVAFWCMFQDYMNEQLPNSIVWSFSPNLEGTWTMERFEKRYPGKERVDLLGCDAYQWGPEEMFKLGLNLDMNFLQGIAQRDSILLALTECGIKNSPVADWWSRVFLPIISRYEVCYFLPWRNYEAEHFGFALGLPTAEDVKSLYEQKQFRLLKDVAPKENFDRDSSETIFL